MRLPRIFPLIMPTLGIILVHQTAPISCLRREGAQPVPVHVIQEARSLNARYRHVLTRQDTHRRISKQLRSRNRNLEPFSTQLLEEHLFQSLPPQADNEQLDFDGAHDSTRNTVTQRQVGLEGSAKPLFFCSPCNQSTQHEQEQCARCKGFVIAQQEKIQKAVLELFPNAKIVATNHKLVNMIFVEMEIAPHDDIAEVDHALSQIPGVLRIAPQEDSTLEDDKAVAYIGGGAPLEQRFCGVGGKGVRISILDSGVDYTHQRVGGAGTRAAYQLAYGTGPDSQENKNVNPEVFPTETVIGGYDFLGESFVHTAESQANEAIPDGNPVDANRHGTMVADAILSVAPQAQLLACKVCTSDTGTCPGFSVLAALEYSLDPNGDDNMDDKVDIVNLSLGGSYLSSYYDLRTEAMERVFQLGVLPVVAAGNEGNIPFVGGPGSKTPNAISVAATNEWSSGSYSVVAPYSSRGPGDENTLKPDISAPSGLTLAAFGTGNELFQGVEGTSFAAPVVAGSLALVKERCPGCSPFALKAILMNNARRHVQYHTGNQPIDPAIPPSDDAPNSLVGAGEVDLEKALGADVWMYCIEDVQPSLSFGVINAHKETILKKRIRVINISGLEQTLRIRNQFSQKALAEAQESPLKFSFSPEEQVLPAECNVFVEFEVTLVVDASKAPPNRMTSGGQASNDPATNDWNEFGGWTIVENVNTSKDISLAYHAIVRQASHVEIQGSKVIENFTGGPTQLNVGLNNLGAGVAQVDAFELLFTSEDDPEGGYGEEVTPSDFRYIGYRVITPEGQSGTCDHLLEFTFTTWEKQKRINLEFFQVHIDVDFDGNIDYILFNSGVFTPFTDNIGCVVRDKSTETISCTGFPPDHGTNSAQTTIRACSNDIGFPTAPTGQTKINIYVLTATATHLGVTEVTDRASEQFHTIEFPQTWISAPSYDIYPGETLQTIEVDGTGGDGSSKPLGLMLVTNSNRGENSTGAASPETETLILTNGAQNLPAEVTPDDLPFPVAEAFQGPECTTWEDLTCAARSGENGSVLDQKVGRNQISNVYRMQIDEFGGDASSPVEDESLSNILTKGALNAVLQDTGSSPAQACPESAVPRSTPLRVPGSVAGKGEMAQNTTNSQTVAPVVNATAGDNTTFAPSSPSSSPTSNTTQGSITQTMSPSAPLSTTSPPTTSPRNSNVTVPQANMSPAPTPLRTPRPSGPLAAAIDLTDRFPPPTPPSAASAIFSLGETNLSPLSGLALVACSSLLALIS